MTAKPEGVGQMLRSWSVFVFLAGLQASAGTHNFHHSSSPKQHPHSFHFDPAKLPSDLPYGASLVQILFILVSCIPESEAYGPSID